MTINHGGSIFKRRPGVQIQPLLTQPNLGPGVRTVCMRSADHVPDHNRTPTNGERAQRSHIAANALLVLTALVFVAALVAYFLLDRGLI
jgi:hypothetical protein